MSRSRCDIPANRNLRSLFAPKIPKNAADKILFGLGLRMIGLGRIRNDHKKVLKDIGAAISRCDDNRRASALLGGAGASGRRLNEISSASEKLLSCISSYDEMMRRVLLEMKAGMGFSWHPDSAGLSGKEAFDIIKRNISALNGAAKSMAVRETSGKNEPNHFRYSLLSDIEKIWVSVTKEDSLRKSTKRFGAPGTFSPIQFVNAVVCLIDEDFAENQAASLIQEYRRWCKGEGGGTAGSDI